MADTLGDLKTRILTETDRDDLGAGEALEAQLALCIARAVEHYSDQRFWFNRAAGSRTTSNAVATVAMPAGVRVAEAVAYGGAPLIKTSVEAIEHRSESGQPSHWAQSGDTIQLWPIPNGIYSLAIYGIAQIDPPAGDGASNAWTSEAQDLIAARTRFLLFRDVLRDVEGTQLAAQAEGEALSRLLKESRRRAAQPLGAAGDEPWTARPSFSIARGY